MDSMTSSRWAARNEARATSARARNTLPSIVTEYTWMETSAENQGPRVVSATARARIATRPKRATKTKFIVADRRDRPTPPGALAQARYLIRAGRSCGAGSRHRRQERHHQGGELRVRDGQLHDPSGPRECENRLQRNVRIQRDRRGQTHDLVHGQRHPGRRPELDPALHVPDQRHGPLEGPVPPLQGRRRLERVPGAPPVRARDVSALVCFTLLRLPPQFGGRSGQPGDLARPGCGRWRPDRADTRPQWGLEGEPPRASKLRELHGEGADAPGCPDDQDALPTFQLQRTVGSLEGGQSRRRCGPGLQEVEVLGDAPDAARVHCDVFRVEPAFRVRIMACPDRISDVHLSDIGSGRDDNAGAVGARDNRKRGLLSPRPPRPVAYESVPRADAGRMEGDEDLVRAGLGDGEAMGREDGRRAGPIDRGGPHRWWDR